MAKLIALDLSTTSTGWALFDAQTKELIHHGFFRPRKCGMKGVTYPRIQLLKMRDLAKQIEDLIESVPDVEWIAIEEVNRGIARLSQKVLDGFHFILVDRIENHLGKVIYRDSDGKTGWRTVLKLYLTEADKIQNAQRRRVNAKISKGQKKLTITNRKHLACRFANTHYSLSLDCDLRESDGDVADAIGLGHAILSQV